MFQVVHEDTNGVINAFCSLDFHGTCGPTRVVHEDIEPTPVLPVCYKSSADGINLGFGE